jgi:hypothetical protein
MHLPRFLRALLYPTLLFAAVLARAQGSERLRGAMIPTFATARDLRDLAALGANSVRWQLTWGGFPSSSADNASLPEYASWLEGALRHVDTMLPLCRSLRFRVVLDLHTPPGGRMPNGEWRLFQHREHQDFFLRTWKGIAACYRGDTTFWAFDLVNEPQEVTAVGDSVFRWRDLALAAALAIRAEDSSRRIVVEGAPNGSSTALAAFEPLPLRNVVYSFHFYDPPAFTHQGLYGDTANVRYPGYAYGKRWNRHRLEQWLKPLVDWQAQHGVPVYVGEFSAVRWAPGNSAYRYLRDCIRIFEKRGWGWAYHAWREADVWSLEHDRTGAHAVRETSRLQLLRKRFASDRE